MNKYHVFIYYAARTPANTRAHSVGVLVLIKVAMIGFQNRFAGIIINECSAIFKQMVKCKRIQKKDVAQGFMF